MATKRELKAEIETLSAELGVSIETDRLNLEGLTKLLEELKQKVAGGRSAPEGGEVSPVVSESGLATVAPPVPPEDPGRALIGATKRMPSLPPQAAEVVPAAEVAPVKPDPTEPVLPPALAPAEPAPLAPAARFYRVAQGCLIYTLRGKIGAFRPIKASDLSGGQEMLDELVRAGQVEAKR